MISLPLKPGVTVIMGQANSGKTRILAWLTEEFRSEGSEVWILAEKPNTHLASSLGNPGVHRAQTRKDLEHAMSISRTGSAFLVDDVELYVESDPSALRDKVKKIAGLTRSLDRLSTRLGHYVVVTHRIRCHPFTEDVWTTPSPFVPYPIYRLGSVS